MNTKLKKKIIFDLKILFIDAINVASLYFTKDIYIPDNFAFFRGISIAYVLLSSAYLFISWLFYNELYK